MPHQYKKLMCEVCEKWMRSDKLGRHAKIHKDLLSLPEEEIKTELKRRHDEKVEQTEKRQKVIAIAEKLNVSIPEELIDLSTGIEDETLDRETLCKEIEDENRRYIAKIELGKMISSIIDENFFYE